MNDLPESLQHILAPRRVAILGASDGPSRIGGRPIHYMKEAGFEGDILPVNPNRETVQGLTAYPTVSDVPGEIDFALVALPAPAVAEAVRASAAKGAKACLIFSSGFAEVGEEGERLQAELTAIARETGVRIIGPNCLGLFNPSAGFYPTFSSSVDGNFPTPGGLAIVTQSGAFGSHLFYTANQKGIGIRTWISTGNESDVDVSELIGHLAEDPGTKVILAYVEGARDGRRLIASLEKARAARKPVLFFKVGRSEVGAEAARSHTAALAGADAVYDGVLRQYGAYRGSTVEELLDVAYAAQTGVYPTGKRIGLVTISGGAGVMMADAAEDAGLDVAPMPEEAQTTLKALLPFAAVRNPVDITAQVLNNLDLVPQFLQAMYREGGYDAMVAFFTMTASSPMIADTMRDRILKGLEGYEDRLTALSIVGGPQALKRYTDAGLLNYEDPVRAIRAFAALMGFGRSFAGQEGRMAVAVPAMEPLPSGPLGEKEAKAILAKAGLPVVEDRLATTAAEAEAAVRAFGRRCALKIASPDILHKTDAGGVRLNVAAEGAADAFDAIMGAAKAYDASARLDGVLISPMAGEGVETILGVQRDPVFGPVVMLGLGGIHVEVLKDVTFRAAPFDLQEARAMIADLRARAIFDGVRGAPPADVEALAEAAHRLSLFAAAHADTVESVDLNPVRVMARGEGVLALDALIVRR